MKLSLNVCQLFKYLVGRPQQQLGNGRHSVNVFNAGISLKNGSVFVLIESNHTQVDVPYLSFTCLTAMEVTQMVDLQVQIGNFQIL